MARHCSLVLFYDSLFGNAAARTSVGIGAHISFSQGTKRQARVFIQRIRGILAEFVLTREQGSLPVPPITLCIMFFRDHLSRADTAVDVRDGVRDLGHPPSKSMVSLTLPSMRDVLHRE